MKKPTCDCVDLSDREYVSNTIIYRESSFRVYEKIELRFHFLQTNSTLDLKRQVNCTDSRYITLNYCPSCGKPYQEAE